MFQEKMESRNLYPPISTGKKIAIVVDGLAVFGGNERVALFLSNTFPDAPIYTSVYLPENTFPEYKSKKIITMPLASRVNNDLQYRRLFPWWYLNFSILNLKGFDIILSSSSYLAKFINPPRRIPHICYLVNPFRFLWKPFEYSKQSLVYGNISMAFIKLLIPFARKIDTSKTRRIDHVITTCQNIASQIQQIYGIESDVIYPPIDIDQFSITETPGDYYLYAGRLISHKRVDLVIQACNQLKRKLVIAGDGIEQTALEKMGGDTVKFVGRVSDKHLKQLYTNCRALLFPSDEDFGLVPVEVQASGRPVIAYRSGGVLETIKENETGIFFDDQDVESLNSAILNFETMDFNPALIRENALRFDQAIFASKFRSYIERFG